MSAAVIIVDSGGANLASLRYALKRQGTEAKISRDPAVVAKAAKVVLPGVGAAADAMRRLREAELHECILELRQPLLGICLGMQLLFTHSEEGDTPCLGVLGGQVRRLHPVPDLPIPHMGWNQCQLQRADPLLQGLTARDYFYFVHSFAAVPDQSALATCEYGRPLAAIVRQDNFWGVQFHPERSAGPGARILRNFLEL